MSADQLSSEPPPVCLEFIEGAIAAESPIHSIPAEILSEVFVRLADSCRPIVKGPFPNTRDEHTSGWRPAMSVCRFWRDTALRTPSLGNTITLDDNDMPSKWAELVMERSRQSLLHLDIPYVVRDVSVFGHAAFKQWHRIRSIALRAHKISGLNKIEAHLPSELPSLESIEVHHWRRINSDATHDSAVDSHYAHALEVLVQAAGPKLARVAITGLNISRTLLTSLPGLKSLSISSPLNMTSWSPVLRLLAGLPGLESFVFVFSEYAAQEEGSVASQLAHLSNLKYLDITSSSLTAVTFLNSLSYPSTATTIVRSIWSREATLPPSYPDTDWSFHRKFWREFDRDIATSFAGVTANIAGPTSMPPIRSLSLRTWSTGNESRRTNLASVLDIIQFFYIPLFKAATRCFQCYHYGW
ncbi:hypothetical protein K474DRAFT_1445156 [Panus rudis PR-1116 ss-1]|nr:hypothetical protein K474DRAFT_1445156 [Panus rudis PR-1116 ss-1]